MIPWYLVLTLSKFHLLSYLNIALIICYTYLEHSRWSVQFSHSVMSDSLWPHGLQHARLSLSITNSQSLLKLKSIESVMPSNHLILCPPLLLLPSIFLSIRVSSNESVLPIRWQKYRSFSFSNRPSSEYSGLISIRVHWFDLRAAQGTLRSLLQHSRWYQILFSSYRYFLDF